MRQISLTDYFCKGLNISPEIFGTLFQSVMDAQERREAGAHYTETANIDKVINGLFLENLRAEFEAVKALKRDKDKKLAAFYQKIQNLQFLDPACGCGNFLIVAYDRIRALEDDIIAEALKDKTGGLFDSPSVQCRLKQFHGIEIDEFAVLIARTAMWLKNHQCNIRTQIRFDGEVACHTLPRNHPRQQPPHTLAGGGLHLRRSALYRLDLPNQRAEKRPRKHLRPYQRLRPVGLRLQLVCQSRRYHGAASPSSDGICFHQFHLPRPAGRNPLGQPFEARHRNPLCPPHLSMDEPSRRQSRRPLHHRRLPPKAANAV
nr:DNA methyltransferase [Neisseria meningitidis]